MSLRGRIAEILTLPLLGAAILLPSGCMNGSIAEGLARAAAAAGGGSGTSLDDLTDFEIYIDPVAIFYKHEELFDTNGYYDTSGYGTNTAPTTTAKLKMIFHLENAIKEELGSTVAAQVLAAIGTSTTLQQIQLTVNYGDMYTWTFDLGDAVANSRWQTLMVIDEEGSNRFVQTATPSFTVQDQATAIENDNGIFLFGGFTGSTEVDWVTFIPDGSDTAYSSKDSGGAYVLSPMTVADGYPVVIPTDTAIYTQINTAWPLVGSKMSADVLNHFLIIHAKDTALSAGVSSTLYDNQDVDEMDAYVFDSTESKVYQYFICSSSYNAGGVSPYRCNRTAPVYSEIFDNAAIVYDGLNGALSAKVNGDVSTEGLWDLINNATGPVFGIDGGPGVAGAAHAALYSSDDGTTVFEVLP